MYCIACMVRYDEHFCKSILYIYICDVCVCFSFSAPDFVTLYSSMPTLFWLDDSDTFMDFLAVTGVVLSALVLLGVGTNAIVFLALWLIYQSFVQVFVFRFLSAFFFFFFFSLPKVSVGKCINIDARYLYDDDMLFDVMLCIVL